MCSSLSSIGTGTSENAECALRSDLDVGQWMSVVALLHSLWDPKEKMEVEWKVAVLLKPLRVVVAIDRLRILTIGYLS